MRIKPNSIAFWHIEINNKVTGYEILAGHRWTLQETKQKADGTPAQSTNKYFTSLLDLLTYAEDTDIRHALKSIKWQDFITALRESNVKTGKRIALMEGKELMLIRELQRENNDLKKKNKSLRDRVARMEKANDKR